MAIDVRCADQARPGMRCQLYAGHEGDHAAVRAKHGARFLPRWATGRPVVELLFADAAHQLPWAPGCPQAETNPRTETSPQAETNPRTETNPRAETSLTRIGAIETAGPQPTELTAPKLTIAESAEYPIAPVRPAKRTSVA